GQLETLAAVRLQAEQLHVAMHAGTRDARLGGERADAPVRRAVSGLAVQSSLDQLGHALVVDRARLTWPQLVVQPIDPPLDETSAPLANRRVGIAQARRDTAVRLPTRAGQHDLRA